MELQHEDVQRAPGMGPPQHDCVAGSALELREHWLFFASGLLADAVYRHGDTAWDGSAGLVASTRAGLTALQAMLLLGAIGMIFGLIIDSPAQMELLASLCGLANRDLWSTMQLHWTLLPWTHVDMWIGGFAAIPLLRTVRPACKRQYCVRVAQNLACSAWMTVGMSCGVLLFEYFASQSGARSAAAMFGCMFAGMVWGMVASVALYRLCFQLRPLVAFNFNRRRVNLL